MLPSLSSSMPTGLSSPTSSPLPAPSPAPSPGTARGLRSELREGQRTMSRLRLLEDTLLAFAHSESTDTALDTALAAACAFTALEQGAVLTRSTDGALHVRTSRGPLLPRGTRVAARGAYGAVLRRPPRPLIRHNTASLLMPGRSRAVAAEWALPLLLAGEPCGALLLASTHPVADPSAGDLQALNAFGAVLAAALRADPARTTASSAEPDELQRLTPRERQVLALLPQGLTNAALGTVLGIAPGTAKIHVERILHKLGLNDRTQAAVRAARWGFLP